ncbi:MAG: glycosyltransferase, partial [Candidatus Riflebacteria bacterium]|nr:glycosyltransferase [Candidatus Riflebacteria bacterium]
MENQYEFNISIAMATYNGEKYLLEQLQSFCKQTILPTELVIYDDCSTDKTCKIIEEFSNTAPFKVKLIRGEKNIGGSVRDGYGMSFSKAAEACKGDYIFFSDQDDVWFPNKIESNAIINKLLPNNEIRFAEERRLFYVAITRCKKQVFL